MSARVKRNAHILKVLAHCHPSVQKVIIRGATKDLGVCLGECAHNILRGNVPLKPSDKARLTKYKKQLRKVASKSVSLKKRKEIIQTGGFLSALLVPLLGSVIAPVAKKVVRKIVKNITN